ncbi:hypothetical protein OAB17_05210 [Flavobacteriaceae bacterium]|jgi:arsenate reductase|nr:hypothetical protein [Flavobacteriaceae bacterium]MDB9781305.1 hypothetical protein [Flavobacteriaceae bacterium]MDB9894059.1 hypothetical protein [Flavobacteriaceae bacterium]MDC1342650.1 hypothetical protein [Flavobacteriaceae bacterium]|tara:strand:- start:10104 stop:10736 length:633 start_codon:yes stop_codon:yes gene_type:complete
MVKTNTTMVKNFFEDSCQNVIIDNERKKLLKKIAKKIAANYVLNNNVANINFICTHNSRRSQLGQVWSFFAANYFKLNINALSGGTEVTAFHGNTVKTLTEVGFKFDIKEFSHTNPTYRISFDENKSSLLGFSKIYDDDENKTPYIVLTTCNNADENCPFIPEASARFHLPYTDPKHSDDSTKQDATYLQTSKIIAAEIYFLFNEIKTLL